MLKAVVDTNILVSSLKASGPPAVIVNLIKDRKIALCYSDPIFLEYQDVLFRKKFNFNPFAVTKLLHSIARFGILIEDNECNIKSTDAADQKFLNAAVGAVPSYGLVYLITGNMKHYPKTPFIVTPVEFLEIYLKNIL